MLVTPRLLAWAINTGIRDGLVSGSKDYLLLTLAGLAVLGAAMMRGVFTFGQQYMTEWIAFRVGYDLRNMLYDRFQRLSFAFHDRNQTGQLMSRATQDVEAVDRFVSMGVLRIAWLILLIGAALTLMLLESWKLALVGWPFLIAILLVSLRFSTWMRPLWTKIQDQLGQVTTVLQENLTGMRVVKAFGRHDYEVKKFDSEALRLFDLGYQSTRLQAINTPTITGLWMLSLALTMWVGGHEVAAGRLSPGGLASFALYLTILQMPVRMAGMLVNMMARGYGAGQRIFEVLDAESAVKEKPNATELEKVRGHVHFESVFFTYDSVSPVLSGINIDAKPGQIIALLGPTGSGKTTVVNLLPRFYDATSGRIAIDGTDIRDVTLASLRACIGTVQQDVFLFSATIRDNISYGVPDATEEDIERVAKAARIHDFIISLPDGYDTWVGERGITLSGGQKQRISIARTLLKNPPILVLDDSTSSVDMETEYLIQQALAEVMKGRTTFVIAQRLRTVKIADQILVLRGGKIVEQGRHDELLETGGFYREIYDLELRDQEEALSQVLAKGQKAVTAPSGGSLGVATREQEVSDPPGFQQDQGRS
jgi:ATP-binding cassette subfamily B protein